MTKRAMRVCLAVLGFATTASLAQAQGAPGFRFGIAGGADFPIQDQSDVYKTGWNAGILFPINFGNSPFGIRFDGTYHRMETKDLTFFAGSGRAEIISGTADLTIGARHGYIQPYLIGGVGAYDMRFHGEDVFANTFSDHSTRFGWNAGGGLAFPLGSSSTRFFVEARYTSVSIDTDRFSNSIHTTGTRFTFVPVSAGFIF